MALLDNKSILVAGVGPGLGLATAYLALRNGASVVVAARSGDRLAWFKEMLSKYGKVEAIQGDLSTEKGAEDVVAKAHGILGRLDGIAVIVGGYAESSIEQLTEDVLFRMLRTNLAAHLYTVKAAAKVMNGGSIVLVSAIWGPFLNWPGRVAYVASKAALARVVETLAAELLPKGIRVNAVAPGGMTKDFTPGREWRSLRRLGDRATPPEDVANIVVWLLSDMSEWVNGAVIPADGGYRFRIGF